MTNNKLYKSFPALCFLFAVVFHFQSTFAMEQEKSEYSKSYLYQTVTAVGDMLDILDCDLYLTASSLPVGESNSILPTFLQPLDLSHLPQEYVDILRHDTKGGELKSDEAIFHQLVAYQREEIFLLKSRLWAPKRGSMLQLMIGERTRHRWLHKLEYLETFEDSLTTLESEKCLDITKYPIFKQYMNQEKVLNSINTKIIKRCFKYLELSKGLLQIPLESSLSRLPLDGVNYMLNLLSPKYNEINGIVLDLSNNYLRWIPVQLPELKKVLEVSLLNNLLCYLPKSFDVMADHITALWLGNFKPFYPLVTNRHTCRTSGNEFKKVPPVVLELKKLEHLDLSSVQLEEFSQDQVYISCPKLRHVNLANNNLQIVPQKDRKNEGELLILVDDYENPGSEPISKLHLIGDFSYDMVARLTSWFFSESTLRAMLMSFP